MANQAKTPVSFKLKLVDSNGNTYISDEINVRNFVSEHHTNSANIPVDQLWYYTKTHIKAKMSFINPNQDLTINIKGVETTFNPKHIVSIAFIVD